MKIKIDLVTRDDQNNEFAVYLVEDGPWVESEVEERLRRLQARLNGVLDVLLSGQLAQRYPETRGTCIRMQVDLHGDAPPLFAELVRAFDEMIHSDDAIRAEIVSARQFVTSIRVVSRADMGR